DVPIAEVGREQRRPEQGGQDEDATHGGRALLGLVALRRVLADRLAAVLHDAQPLDQPGPDEEREHEGRDQGHERPEGQVAEDVEDDVVPAERDEEIVEHSSHRVSRAISASLTRSMRIPREPFTSTTSPGATRLSSSATVSSNVPMACVSATPAARASPPPAARARAPAVPAARPIPMKRSAPASAASRPAFRCAASVMSPSSSMSPSTITRRPLRARPAAAA